jgi:hypothetical protein
MLKHLKKLYLKTPIIPSIWRGIKKFLQKDPLGTLLYTKLVEGKKLSLPWICPEKLCSASGSILFPVQYPLNAGEDASLMFILFIMNMAKGRKEKRFMPVGGHRARTKNEY